MARGNYAEGLDHVDRSLHRNWTHHKGRQLKASFLRKMHEYDRAEALIENRSPWTASTWVAASNVIC